MQIKNMSKEAYNKFIEYVFQKCNIMQLKKYANQHSQSDLRVIEVILKSKPKEVKITYNKKCLEKLYTLYQNNPIIFNQTYIERYEKNRFKFNQSVFEEMIDHNRKATINASVAEYMHNTLTTDFLIRNYKNIIWMEEDINKKEDHGNSYYYFKLDSNLKEEMQRLNTIFEWQYPETLEDISFFKKDGQRWMWSVSHEDVYEISFQETDKEEYEYLKSIGIEFVEKEFTPTPKSYLHYIDEYITNN